MRTVRAVRLKVVEAWSWERSGSERKTGGGGSYGGGEDSNGFRDRGSNNGGNFDVLDNMLYDLLEYLSVNASIVH